MTLDLGKLGARAGLKGYDVWQPEKTYTLSQAWEDKIPPRGFRLVVWTTPSANADVDTEKDKL